MITKCLLYVIVILHKTLQIILQKLNYLVFGLEKKWITKLKIILRVEKNLVSFFAVEDTFIKSKKSIIFNTKTAFYALNSHNIVISNNESALPMFFADYI